MSFGITNPFQTYFLLACPGSTIPVTVEGGVPGGMVQVYKTIEGQFEQYISNFVLDGNGCGYTNIEALLQTEFIATTGSGAIVGDKTTFRFELWQPFPPLPIDNAYLVVMTVPGMIQTRWQSTPAATIANQDITASTAIGVRNGLTGIVTSSLLNAATSGPSGAGVGACCPCASIGQSGLTDGVPFNASGDHDNDTGVVSTQSRGLPLIYATRHTGKEMYKGPWGWYRTLGVYRRLFEQDPGMLFPGHVSILREDGTRAGYLKSGSDYQPATGAYDSLVKTASGWFEKTKEGIYYEYNAHGNLKRVLDPNRNEQYYLYDGNTSSQRLTEIKAQKGLRPYFYYNDPNGDTTLNTRVALRDPLSAANARYIYFNYDVDGYLTKAVGPEGCQWYYEYDKIGSGYNYKGKITKITDPDGYDTHFGFDSSG